ncbi:hypothetical protein RRG08_018966 [Elysia crispata]|uniref:Secreted protein n=1 Tax=Elysia crispata TaxID=231223 RepID=A0AAE1A534_9GAST|nr:hypothetical protein RRG08_018966 [Elysia crispata]
MLSALFWLRRFMLVCFVLCAVETLPNLEHCLRSQPLFSHPSRVLYYQYKPVTKHISSGLCPVCQCRQQTLNGVFLFRISNQAAYNSTPGVP